MIPRALRRLSLLDSRLVWAAVIAACAATFACDSAPLLAPTNSTITLNVSTRVVPVGGTAQLVATVLENSGYPVPNGTSVRFTTSLGTVNPAEAQTTNGTATATFVAGNESGIATVRALSGLANGGTTGGTITPPPGTTPPTTTAANVVEITIGAAAASRVTLSANPSTVRPSGSSVEITALVNDTTGNALPNVQVSFSTTRGTIIPAVANTDASGIAKTTLSASETATVTARVGSGADNRTTTLEVRAATVASFTLATSPATPTVGQPVTLTITPAANTAPRVTVSWGDGVDQDIGVVAAARSVTHTYTAAGFYTINATGISPEGEAFSNAITVTVAQQPGVQLTVTPTSGSVGTIFTFTITPTTGALIQNVTINYGDGTSDDLGPLSIQRTVTHFYSTAGPKTVTVTQREVNGNITTASVTVSVTQ